MQLRTQYNTGKISEERIDVSVKKILEAKELLKLNENKLIDESKVLSAINDEVAR